MLMQKHREYSKTPKEGVFAVATSQKEIFDDLKKYCKDHMGEAIYYFVHPVKPSKENLRPEYMMEIELGKNDGCLMLFWKKAQ